MPILPENRHRYPDNWHTEIVLPIRLRAHNRCEGCGVRNRAWGYRDSTGEFHETPPPRDCTWRLREKLIQIVCTVAHLNHKPEDCRPENLRFWCQRCHNLHDAKHRRETIRRRRDRKVGQRYLFPQEAR